MRYYLEQRDPEFSEKMAEVLCVYRRVKLLKKVAVASKKKPSDAVAIRQCLAYRPCSCCVRLFPRSPLLRHAYFVARSQTPRNCCVRFVAGVTVGSRNTCYRPARYGLTRTGLAPVGLHQLLLAPSEIQARGDKPVYLLIAARGSVITRLRPKATRSA